MLAQKLLGAAAGNTGGGGITFVASAEARAASNTSVTCDVPTGTQNGDLMVAATLVYDSRVWNAATGWTQRAINTTNYPVLRILTRIASSEPANYTFSVTSSTAAIKAAILTFRSAAYDVAGAIAATGNDTTTLVVPAITVATADSLLLAIVGTRTSVQTSVEGIPSLFDSSGTNPTLQIFSETVGSGSTGTRSFTPDVSNRRQGGLISLSPA